MKEAKSWQTLRELAQTQEFENAAKLAGEQFQDFRQQAIHLSIKIEEKEKQLVPLRETFIQASLQLSFHD